MTHIACDSLYRMRISSALLLWCIWASSIDSDDDICADECGFIIQCDCWCDTDNDDDDRDDDDNDSDDDDNIGDDYDDDDDDDYGGGDDSGDDVIVIGDFNYDRH